MAEFTNTNIVTVAAGQNVPLTETAVNGKPCIVHREGAGIVTLRGLTQQCRARFKVGFGANIAIAAGGTVIEMILTQLVINLRYALMGISITQRLDDRAKPIWKRMLLCNALTDEIYAVVMTKPDSVGSSYIRGVLTVPYLGWVCGTLLGAVLGAILPARLEAALGIMLYAMFLAIIVPPMRRERGICLVVALAAGFRCLMTYLPPLSRISEGFAIILCAVPAALIVSAFCPTAEEKVHDSN